MSLAFLKAWMLLGAALVAIPIVIHLFNKPRHKIEAWGAMMFLVQAFEVRARRIRLEQVLLLFLRSLFIVLLALALARPVFKWGEGWWEDPTTHVVILDGSYSMNQGEGEENAFGKAREATLEIVENMRDTDNMILIRGGNKAQLVFPNPSFDKEFLSAKVEAQEPGIDQVMDLPKAFEQAYWMLDQATLPRHRIYVLTDGQVHGWREEETKRWKGVAETHGLLDVEPSTYVFEQKPRARMKNFAVLKAYARSPVVDVHRPTKFLVELGNYTPEKETVHVTFRANGEVYAERDVELPPGVSTIEFDHAFEAGSGPDAAQDAEDEKPAKTSSHYVTVEIDEDDLDQDNVVSLALEVRHAIPILVVEGREAEDMWVADGGLLSLALGSAAMPGRPGLFEVTRKNLHEVEEEDTDLSRHYKAVVLANVPSLSRHFQFVLEQFAERGGGVLLTLGDRVDADAYNRMANGGKGIVPAVLEEVEAYDERPFRPSFPAGIAGYVLDIFDVSRTRVLSEVRVEKFWRCRASEDAVVMGVFDDAPFLAYRKYGEGRVALWTTSADARWTNFPLTQDYLPLLQNLLIYLAGSVQPPINLAQGETLVYTRRLEDALADEEEPSEEAGPADGDEPAAEEEEPEWEYCTITTPDGEAHEAPGEFVGDEWVAEWQDTTLPGIYTVTMEGALPKYYAVSFVPGEGDLSPLDDQAREDFGETVVSGFVDDREQLDLAISEETGVKEWWRTLVLLGLLLLCGELYLGWRFGR